jgi:hypothetical protein
MKVLQQNEVGNKINGTSLKGYLDGVSYVDLVDTLGQPTYTTPSGDDKVTKEWVVQYNDEIFTIYDWKTPSSEYTETQLLRWNVGGKSLAYNFIKEVDGRITTQTIGG